MSPQELQLQQQYATTIEKLNEAATIAGRPREAIKLLAVSKKHSAESIRLIYSLGQRAFGENYLQEAREKQQALEDLDIEWHFIGPLQSNKTREVAENFSWAHSIDRLKIAQRLSQQRPENLTPLNVCLQVNIDNEISKSGVTFDQLPELIIQVSQMPGIKLRGLMAIPAPKDKYDEQLACFQRLSAIMLEYPKLDTLSMGMSNDLQAAIVAGSTIVRIGTGIFGQR
jgi:pyridoxal phosphate enzyme (YggS family)